jgi:hypothetical protein
MFPDRDVYPFADGVRRGDPLAIQRRLFIHTKGRVNDLIAARDGEDLLAAAEAEEELIVAARTAFGFGEFEAGGVIDAEVLAELDRFAEYLEGKGQGRPTTPGGSHSSDCPPGSVTTTSSDSP